MTVTVCYNRVYVRNILGLSGIRILWRILNRRVDWSRFNRELRRRRCAREATSFLGVVSIMSVIKRFPRKKCCLYKKGIDRLRVFGV